MLNITSSVSLNEEGYVYPYEGVLYLATSESLEKNNWLKYGHTTKTAEERGPGHSGQTTFDKSTTLFSVNCLDSLRAETLLKAYLYQLDLPVSGRKEIIKRNFELAKSLLIKAARLAKPRKAKRLAPAPEVIALTTNNPAWAALIEYNLKIGNNRKSLAQWMAQSLQEPSLSKRLAKMGFICVNCDRIAPEFKLEFLEPHLEQHLFDKGYEMDSLIDADDSIARAIFVTL